MRKRIEHGEIPQFNPHINAQMPLIPLLNSEIVRKSAQYPEGRSMYHLVLLPVNSPYYMPIRPCSQVQSAECN
jgi:hypothetical protein